MSSLNLVIKVFLTQPIQNISATTLSSLISVLKDSASGLSPWDQSITEDGEMSSILQRLISIANDGSRNTTIRVMALECLFWISYQVDDAFRQGTLFETLLQLNESFEAMLEQDGSALDHHYLMLTVLLLRASGYERVKVRDLVHNLYQGDTRRVISLLLRLLENDSYEWPLSQAAARCLFELTTPACYFDANTNVGGVIDVSAFQAKLSSLLEHSIEGHIFESIFAELVKLWRRSWAGDRVLEALGSTHSSFTVSDFTSHELTKLAQWASLLHFVCATLGNLSEYCEKQELVRSLRWSLLSQSVTFLTEVALPFVTATIQAWLQLGRGGLITSENSDGVKIDPTLYVAVEVLQLLRFALYRPRDNLALKGIFLTALANFGQYILQHEPALGSDCTGMAVLFLTVQLLCNVNARQHPALIKVFEALLGVIASDESVSSFGIGISIGNTFIAQFHCETSPYFDTQNESVEFVQNVFSKHAKENAEVGAAFSVVEEQLDLVRMAIIELTLGQSLEELIRILPFPAPLQEVPSSCTKAKGKPRLGEQAILPTSSSQSEPGKKPKRLKYPAKYCCQLTKKLMREPVTLRSGHHFELDALKKVIAEMGHVNPLTGETINEEVEVNEALQQEITAYRVKCAARLE